ncbi:MULTISPECIES: SatD family protein [Sphingomonas]|nr:MULTISPECIES: SatD family protein [Sphingomonas]
MESRTYAVVMGDLVASEAATSRRALHRVFNAAIDDVNAAQRATLVSPLTITLGDEFQGLAETLADAIRIARRVRFALMAQDVACRVLVGEVAIDTPVNPDRAWNMMGDGLARARSMLDRKRDTSLYLFALNRRPKDELNLLAMGAGLTAIERRWTARQREDILATLDGSSVEEIAARRGVSTHSVYKVRTAGQNDAYQLLWEAVGNTLSSIDFGWDDRP